MKFSSTILFSTMALASPLITSRASAGTIKVSDFTATSAHGSPMVYHFHVEDNEGNKADCWGATINVTGKCDGASVPGILPRTVCSNRIFRWELIQAAGPQAMSEFFNIKITKYDKYFGRNLQDSACGTIHGDKLTCAAVPGSSPNDQGATWKVKDFSLDLLEGDSQCGYTS